MKKLNEKELVEVKGGFIGGVADPNGSFFLPKIKCYQWFKEKFLVTWWCEYGLSQSK